MKNKLKSGFTLIELLVVISIIGVLTAVILPNLVGMRERARDSQLKSEMNELKNALRLYYNDFQQYPANNTAGQILGCGTNGTDVCAWGGSFEAKGNTYMQQLPESNVSASENIMYSQTDSGDGFIAHVLLENVSDAEVDTSSTVGESGTRCGVSSAIERAYYVCSH